MACWAFACQLEHVRMWKQPALSRYVVPVRQQVSQICFLSPVQRCYTGLHQTATISSLFPSGPGDHRRLKTRDCFLPLSRPPRVPSCFLVFILVKTKPPLIPVLPRTLWSWTTTLSFLCLCPCLWCGGDSHTYCMMLWELNELAHALCLVWCLTLYKDLRPFFFLFSSSSSVSLFF